METNDKLFLEKLKTISPTAYAIFKAVRENEINEGKVSMDFIFRNRQLRRVEVTKQLCKVLVGEKKV